MVRKNIVRAFSRGGNRRRQSTQAVCAMPSMTSTPGITGLSGKWPANCGSFIVMFLMPTPYSSPRIPVTRSISRNG
jgi:hypothetical protein